LAHRLGLTPPTKTHTMSVSPLPKKVYMSREEALPTTPEMRDRTTKAFQMAKSAPNAVSYSPLSSRTPTVASIVFQQDTAQASTVKFGFKPPQSTAVKMSGGSGMFGQDATNLMPMPEFNSSFDSLKQDNSGFGANKNQSWMDRKKAAQSSKIAADVENQVPNASSKFGAGSSARVMRSQLSTMNLRDKFGRQTRNY
jgi:hypothetical protein